MLDKSAITKAAQQFTAKGQIDKAITEWEKLVKESPDGNIFNIIGDLYLRKKAKREALEAFEKAAALFKEDGFYLKAMALYKKILNLAPLAVNALVALAELNAEKGLIGNANENYLTAADIYIQEGAIEKALDIYERILKLAPFNINIKIKIVELYLKIGLKNEAVKECVVIASDYLDKGENGKAQEFYLKAIGLDVQNIPTLIGLSKIAENENNLKQAYEYLNNAMSFAYDNNDVLFNYSRLAVKTGNVDKAKETLTKLIELDPSNNSYKKLLGNIYLKEGLLDKAWHELLPYIDDALLNGQWDEALELLNNFREHEPLAVKRRLTTISIYKGNKNEAINELRTLADIYKSKELFQEALQSYKEILELDPSDDTAQKNIKEIGKVLGIETVPPETLPVEEKPAERILSETDVYIRHGLVNEAISELEKLKEREPDNIDVRSRLRDIYIGNGDKNNAIGECLYIAELYEKKGDLEARNNVISVATRLNPDDSRLAMMKMRPTIVQAPVKKGKTPTEKAKEVFEEKFSEADFYAQQGLTEEAIKVYEELLSIFPDNKEVIRRLKALKPEEKPAEKEHLAEPSEAIKEPVAREAISDLKDIFNEFKKGVEEELGDKDYETRYNLGIAYKEMGLLEDAIREFQVAAKDSGKAVQSAGMLALCYMDKKDYSRAIKEFKKVFESMATTDHDYLAAKCDLADAYVKNKEYDEALKLYMEIYKQDPKFRDVAKRVEILKTKSAGEEKKPKLKKDRVSYI